MSDTRLEEAAGARNPCERCNERLPRGWHRFCDNCETLAAENATLRAKLEETQADLDRETKWRVRMDNVALGLTRERDDLRAKLAEAEADANMQSRERDAVNQWCGLAIVASGETCEKWTLHEVVANMRAKLVEAERLTEYYIKSREETEAEFTQARADLAAAKGEIEQAKSEALGHAMAASRALDERDAAQARAETAVSALKEIAAEITMDGWTLDAFDKVDAIARRTLSQLTQQPQQGQKDDQ